MKLLLSIDGGGVKGVAVSQFLYRLEKELNKPLYEVFDMYAGTSTGSLISSAIGYQKFTGDELIHKLYTLENIKKIMNKSYIDKILGLLQTRPKYNGIGKREIIKKYVNIDRRIDDSNGKDIMITTFDINTQKPVFFKSWDPYSTSSGGNVLIVDAVDASSSAPGYFPSIKIDNFLNIENFKREVMYAIDGSVAVTNPTDCMYVDMKDKYPKEEIRILSIGTGKHINTYKNGTNSIKWGGIEWATEGNLIDILMSGPNESVDYRMKSLTKDLGHKYIRVNGPILNDSLDDVSEENYKILIKIGDEWWDKFGKEVVEMINS